MSPVLLNPSRFGAAVPPSAYQTAVSADAPRLYLKLDETAGTTAADSSGGGHDGSYVNTPAVGTTSLLPDAYGKALGLTANTGQCASVPSASWMNGWTALSVEALVTFTSAVDNTNGDSIVNRYGSGGFEFILYRDISGKFQFQVQTGGSFRAAVSTTTPTNGVKYHVVGTWDGTNARIYVNGVLEATTSAPGALASSTEPIEVGRYSNSSNTTPGGVIDEVAVYDTALSAARVAAHFVLANKYSATVIAESPALYWRMGEASGTTVTDFSGNARNGSYVSSPSLNQGSLVTDGSGSSVNFVPNQYATIADAAWMESTSITMVCRYRHAGTVAYLPNRWGSGTSNRAWLFTVGTAGNATLQVNNSAAIITLPNGTFSSGTTYSVAVRFDNTNADVFINGVKVATVASAGPITTASAEFLIARAEAAAFSTLRCSEAAFWPSALTDAKIAALHAAA